MWFESLCFHFIQNVPTFPEFGLYYISVVHDDKVNKSKKYKVFIFIPSTLFSFHLKRFFFSLSDLVLMKHLGIERIGMCYHLTEYIISHHWAALVWLGGDLLPWLYLHLSIFTALSCWFETINILNHSITLSSNPWNTANPPPNLECITCQINKLMWSDMTSHNHLPFTTKLTTLTLMVWRPSATLRN